MHFSEIRSDLQDGGGPAAENGRAFVLAADDVAAGECALKTVSPGDGGNVDKCTRVTARAGRDHAHIDDTFDAVHGDQQLSLFKAHYAERCFLPIHIYEGTSGKPVAVSLREGKTPAGRNADHPQARDRTIRGQPKVRLLERGDSHYGRVGAMEWCDRTPFTLIAVLTRARGRAAAITGIELLDLRALAVWCCDAGRRRRFRFSGIVGRDSRRRWSLGSDRRC